MRVLLDSFSKQERTLFLEEHKGEQGNGFRPRRWRGHGCSFQLRIPRTRSGAFQPIILGILAAQESERALLFHEQYLCILSKYSVVATIWLQKKKQRRIKRYDTESYKF